MLALDMRPRRLQHTWDALGRTDPFWAVLTHADKRGNRWDPTEFMRTGVDEIANVVRYATALRPELGRGRALDFGCGVGRLSQALADHFERVHGVDIAPSMLTVARRINRHGDRCEYHLNETCDLRAFASRSFDLVYSSLTLQHMPPRYMRAYLAEFGRVVASNGLVIVQIPAAREAIGPPTGLLRRAGSGLWRRARALCRRTPPIEMYGMSPEAVIAVLGCHGLMVVDVMPNDAAGPGWSSYRYCARVATVGECH
jgi:ubiquinone/menaquinone biosynthesis C-methylase UbiE